MTAIQIAVKSAFQLWHIGKIQEGTLELAKKMGISSARLHAMARFIQTKGEPCQYRRIYP